jgi:hypothetical protein
MIEIVSCVFAIGQAVALTPRLMFGYGDCWQVSQLMPAVQRLPNLLNRATVAREREKVAKW